MKASLKFREDEKPLLRAKIPLSILGLPFLSSVSAGDASELSMSLATSFDAGPSLRLSYQPNDPANAFRLVVKTGVGPFGSPAESPLSISTEFDLLQGGRDPKFFIRFSPRAGDFSLKKTAFRFSRDSVAFFGRKLSDGWQEHSREEKDGGDGSAEGLRLAISQNRGAVVAEQGGSAVASGSFAGMIDGLFAGVEIHARSVFPVRKHATVSFRWGFRAPAGPSSAGISLGSMPVLVISKVGIEQVTGDATRLRAKVPDLLAEGDDEASCKSVWRQLEELRAESRELKKAAEELRSKIHGGGREWSRPVRKNASPDSVEGPGRSTENVR